MKHNEKDLPKMYLAREKRVPQNRVKMFSQLFLEKIETIQLTGYERLLRDTLYIQRYIQVESKKMGKIYNVNSNQRQMLDKFVRQNLSDKMLDKC